MKKFKYHPSGTGKGADRYFSKIRSRKIEKCLSQLQDALQKNDGLVTGPTRSIDVAVFMDNASSNNSFNTDNMQQNIYPKYTETYYQKQDNGIFDQQLSPMLSNQAKELSWNNHKCYDLQSNNTVKYEVEENKDKHFTTTNLQLSDPRLCMLFFPSNWRESCDGSSNCNMLDFVCESKETLQENQQHVDDDKNMQNGKNKNIEWDYNDLEVNPTNTQIYDIRKQNYQFDNNICYDDHFIYTEAMEKLKTNNINIENFYQRDHDEIVENQPSNISSD